MMIWSQILPHGQALAQALQSHATTDEEAEILKLFVQSIQKWAKHSLSALEIDQNAKIDPHIFREAAALGLWGITVPTEWGGSGLSMSASAKVVSTLAYWDRSVATTIGLHAGLGLRGLIAQGSTALKDRFLNDLAQGKKIAAFAATEPQAGSHIAAVSTTALPKRGGLEIQGQKIFCTNGGFADLFTILAKTPGLGGARKGWSLLLVPRDTPGFEIGAPEHKLGIRGSSTTSLYFDRAWIPLEYVIGKPSQGLNAFDQILAWGRTLMSAGALGAAMRAFDQARDHALQRVQFNHAIAEFGPIRKKIAWMKVQLWAMDNALKLVTHLQDRHLSILMPSAALKVFCSESSWEIADHAVQIFGGMGYIRDTGIGLILRDLRITRIFEGANEVLKQHLALAALTSKSSISSELNLELPQVLKTFGETFQRWSETLSSQMEDLKKIYKFQIFKKHLVLEGLAEAILSAFVLLASILKVAGTPPAFREEAVEFLTYLRMILTQRFEAGLEQARTPELHRIVQSVSNRVYQHSSTSSIFEV